MERIREYVNFDIILKSLTHHPFLCPFLPWSLSMHLSVWLHCLEELEGLVHVMALSVLTYRGATILQPSEGSDAATVH